MTTQGEPSTALERLQERVRLAADNDQDGFTKALLGGLLDTTVKNINRKMWIEGQGEPSTIYESFLREYVYFKLAIGRIRKNGLRRLYEKEYGLILYYEKRSAAAREAAMESLNDL